MLIMAGGRQIRKLLSQAKVSYYAPCGGCRQKIREFGTADTQIVICDDIGPRQTFTLDVLLPHSFGPDNLEK